MGQEREGVLGQFGAELSTYFLSFLSFEPNLKEAVWSGTGSLKPRFVSQMNHRGEPLFCTYHCVISKASDPTLYL